MADMPMDAGKKLGPLPMWGWGALLGLVVVGYLYFKGRSGSNSAPVNPSATGAVLPDLTANDLGSSGNLAGSDSTQSPPTMTTNAAWEATAVAWAVTQGLNPLTVQTAIEDYLDGVSLSFEQGQIISKVLAQFGEPPQGVNSPPVVGAPPPPVGTPVKPPVSPPKKTTNPPKLPVQHPPVKPPTTAKPKTTSITIRWGDTLSGLAVKYHTTVAELMKLNPSIHNPNLIYAGNRLVVPT